GIARSGSWQTQPIEGLWTIQKRMIGTRRGADGCPGAIDRVRRLENRIRQAPGECNLTALVCHDQEARSEPEAGRRALGTAAGVRNGDGINVIIPGSGIGNSQCFCLRAAEATAIAQWNALAMPLVGEGR